MVQKYTYNNKQYVVKTGSRGGSYITVGRDRRKVYIKTEEKTEEKVESAHRAAKGGKGSTSSSSHSASTSASVSRDSLLSDEDDDSFFKNYKEKQMQDMKTAEDPLTLIKRFLATTSIPYVVIGGKAAAYHIQTLTRSFSNQSREQMDLAQSTNDYDVLIKHTQLNEFLGGLKSTMGATINRFDIIEKEMLFGDIILVGNKKNGIMGSVIDIHTLNKANHYKFPKEKDIVRGKDGIKYAPLNWICEDLDHSLKNFASMEDIIKTLKRQARYKLLDCKDSK
jgi:hypothetical protein